MPQEACAFDVGPRLPKRWRVGTQRADDIAPVLATFAALDHHFAKCPHRTTDRETHLSSQSSAIHNAWHHTSLAVRLRRQATAADREQLAGVPIGCKRQRHVHCREACANQQNIVVGTDDVQRLRLPGIGHQAIGRQAPEKRRCWVDRCEMAKCQHNSHGLNHGGLTGAWRQQLHTSGRTRSHGRLNLNHTAHEPLESRACAAGGLGSGKQRLQVGAILPPWHETLGSHRRIAPVAVAKKVIRRVGKRAHVACRHVQHMGRAACAVRKATRHAASFIDQDHPHRPARLPKQLHRRDGT